MGMDQAITTIAPDIVSGILSEFFRPPLIQYIKLKRRYNELSTPLPIEDLFMDTNPMELFKKEAPEVAAAFNDLIMSLVASKGLDAKTKQLIYIAMKAALGDDTAVKAHIPMAKAAGATRDEVIDAILLTLTVSGIRGVVHCLPEAVRQYENV